MAVKPRHFLLAAFILAISALEGSPSAGAYLAVGEARFPPSVVVRINDAASSAEEGKRWLKEKFGVTVEERRKAVDALRSAAEANRLQLKLEIINALNYTIQSICNEYISYVYQFYARIPTVSLKEVVIAVSDRQSRGSEGKCVYKVEQGPKITREDGSLLPDIALEKFQLDEQNSITIAFLSETNEIGIQLPVKEILIVVPFATADILDLAPYLTRAAQKLYSVPAYEGKIINFLVAEKSAQDTHSLPSLMVMAFKTVSGSVFLTQQAVMQQKFGGYHR